jgi:hypothetical protein
MPRSRKALQDMRLAFAEPRPPCACGVGVRYGAKRLITRRLGLEPRALGMTRYRS